jgi:hypothetical protein
MYIVLNPIVTEMQESSFVGCDAVWLCVWLLMFVSTNIPLFSIIKQPKNISCHNWEEVIHSCNATG